MLLTRRASRFPRLVLLALLSCLIPSPEARADLVPPAGWFSGDIHIHRTESCLGVSDPVSVFNAMPSDLNVASVLVWCAGGHFMSDAMAYFLGQQDAPVSTPTQIVHYDLEVSSCGDADRLAHGSYLNLADINFPTSTYQGPIQDWAKDQPGTVIGVDHASLFASGYGTYPPLDSCCVPFEAPLSVALGRADFISYQPLPADPGPFRFLYYTLLDTGFRPGLASGSDASCLPFPLGSMRTYARLDGGLTYPNYTAAIAAGRTVVVEDTDNFIEFTVDSVGTGEQLDVALGGTQVELRARLIAPQSVAISGTLEIVKNHQVVASHPYSNLTGEYVLSVFDTVDKSAWYAARTAKSHTGAVFAILADAPIRANVESPTYYLDYMDWLENLVVTGFFSSSSPIDETALLADIAAARAIFEQIETEAMPEPGSATGLAAGIAALMWLAHRKKRLGATNGRVPQPPRSVPRGCRLPSPGPR
jgi:hypothetical protein